jgi:hypothetical protein
MCRKKTYDSPEYLERGACVGHYGRFLLARKCEQIQRVVKGQKHQQHVSVILWRLRLVFDCVYALMFQGPPGVGKTTLIKSLVKHYTRHNLSQVRGPINIVAGKNRRLTIVECGTRVLSPPPVSPPPPLHFCAHACTHMLSHS